MMDPATGIVYIGVAAAVMVGIIVAGYSMFAMKKKMEEQNEAIVNRVMTSLHHNLQERHNRTILNDVIATIDYPKGHGEEIPPVQEPRRDRYEVIKV